MILIQAWMGVSYIIVLYLHFAEHYLILFFFLRSLKGRKRCSIDAYNKTASAWQEQEVWHRQRPKEKQNPNPARLMSVITTRCPNMCKLDKCKGLAFDLKQDHGWREASKLIPPQEHYLIWFH